MLSIHRKRQEERQAWVRGVVESAPVPVDATDWRWVPAEWLQSWANASALVGPVPVRELVCQHGRLALAAAPRAKRVTVAAYQALVGEAEGLREGGAGDKPGAAVELGPESQCA